MAILPHETPEVARLRAEVAEIGRLRAALLECASDLEDELRARYGTPPHPAEVRRFNRDMETVQMARRLAHQGAPFESL